MLRGFVADCHDGTRELLWTASQTWRAAKLCSSARCHRAPYGAQYRPAWPEGFRAHGDDREVGERDIVLLTLTLYSEGIDASNAMVRMVTGILARLAGLDLEVGRKCRAPPH